MEREIIKHLDLCATLMSDPEILRKYPNIVADQFLAAKSSIESLGVFLPSRPVDKCDCHVNGWMDLSVIKNGIGQLVTKLLATHLGTVRLEKFPCVLEVDFKNSIDGEPDNYTTREIKETNCMGSIVLLYYYLYWYLFLIRMNQRIDPNYCTVDKLDIKSLIAKLPRSHAFLEFRTLWDVFCMKGGTEAQRLTKIDALRDNTRATYPFMFGNITIAGREQQTRKTLLVAAYRRALDTNIGVDHASDAGVEFDNRLNTKTSFFIFNALTTDTILRGASVMGGMVSVFERSEATQKWKDMHTPIQVLGLTEAGGPSKFNGKMAKILSAMPYSRNAANWKDRGTRACLYDYCSAALMMDVCRSFQKLAELVNALSNPTPDDQVFKYLNSFLRNLAGYSAETLALVGRLKARRVLELRRLEERDQEFVSKSEADLMYQDKTFMFQRPRHLNLTALHVWLDEFKNYYPMRNTGVLNDVNRRCFLCDIGPEEGCTIIKWLEVVQSEMIMYAYTGAGAGSRQFCTSYSMIIMASFMRNSWMVNHGSASVNELIKRASYAAGFRNVPVLFGSDNNLFSADEINAGFAEPIRILHNSVPMGFTDVAVEEAMRYFPGGGDPLRVECTESPESTQSFPLLSAEWTPGVAATTVSFADISAFVKSQQRALAELTKASNGFDRYPALAWPVTSAVVGGAETTNIARFERIRDRTRRPGHVYGPGDQDRRAEDAATRAEEAARAAQAAMEGAGGHAAGAAQAYQDALLLAAPPAAGGPPAPPP